MDTDVKRIQRRKLIKETRRYNRPLSRCKRIELPIAIPWIRDGTPIDSRLKKMITDGYPEVELFWHPLRHTWELYRVTHKAAAPAWDTMTHEFTLKAPPGIWLYYHLKKHDVFTKVNNTSVANHVMKNITEQEERRDEEFNNKIRDLSGYIARESRMILRGRESIIVPGEI